MIAEQPYQVMPPLDDEQRHALRQSIQANGVLEPIVVDEDGNILDGHHRAEIADDLGIDFPTRVLAGLDEAGKLRYAITTNAIRRQLAPAQVSSMVARLWIKGMSIRQIAEQTDMPKSTVARHLSQVSHGGTPETVTGKDNKTYPATRPARAPGPADAADCPPADPGANPDPVAHPSWPTESELKPWETLAPTADRVAESMEPIADDPRDRTHGAEFESYDVATPLPDPTPAHYETSGWTGGDSGSGVACACGMQFDGFASLAEAGELLARHIETPEPDAFTSTAPSGSGLAPAPAADAPVPSQEPAPMAPPRQVQVEEGRKCAETLVEYVRADVLAIIAAVDLGEDLITEQLVADLQAAVDLLASRLEVNA